MQPFPSRQYLHAAAHTQITERTQPSYQLTTSVTAVIKTLSERQRTHNCDDLTRIKAADVEGSGEVAAASLSLGKLEIKKALARYATSVGTLVIFC